MPTLRPSAEAGAPFVRDALVLPLPVRAAAFALFALLLAGLFIGGAQPVAVGLFNEPWDKVAHFGLFGVLAGLAMIATNLRRPAVVLAAVVAVGVLDEWHQSGLPGRHADLPDLLTDVTGALIAVSVLAFVRRRV